MPNRFANVCAYIEEAEASLRGNNVHIAAKSGENLLEFCMSRGTASALAKSIKRKLDAADIMEQDRLYSIKTACHGCEAFRA